MWAGDSRSRVSGDRDNLVSHEGYGMSVGIVVE